MNTITVVMTTYFPDGPVGESRFESCGKTLYSWGRYMWFDGDLRFIIVNGPEAVSEKRQVALLNEVYEVPVKFMHSSLGIGAALNLGVQEAHHNGPLTLYAADDWALDAPIDLTPWADLLLTDPRYGMVRLGPPHPHLTGTIEHFSGTWAMVLDRHHYAFGHRPALYHQRLYDAYGWYDERANAFDVERQYNEHFNTTPGPDILYALPYPWQHVGTVEVGDHAVTV